MNAVPAEVDPRERRFREAYARHRAAEGREASAEDQLTLPYLRRGPHARHWQVRARTFDRFLETIVNARAREISTRSLCVADLGAGNGWLCYRLGKAGHTCIAFDVRTDPIDGLGAATVYRERVPFACVNASFESLPLAARLCDLAVFNASLHYALDLRAALMEAARIVVSGGRVVILDSPFYDDDAAGAAMVAEKKDTAGQQFGDLATDLMALPFIEYLTPVRLEAASTSLGLQWQQHRVRYPLWYELRPLAARLRGRRIPSRFDLWQAVVP